MRLHGATELGQRTQWIAEALMEARKSAPPVPSVAMKAARELRNFANVLLNIGGVTGYYISRLLTLATSLDGQQPDERFSNVPARIAYTRTWWPIATAPRDGSEFLGRHASGTICSYFWKNNEFLHYDPDNGLTSYIPVEWAPINTDPVALKAEAAPPVPSMAMKDAIIDAVRFIRHGFVDDANTTLIAALSAQVHDVTGWQLVPTELTPEIVQHLQMHTEMGAYVCENLSGAYSLMDEYHRAMLAAAPAKAESGA